MKAIRVHGFGGPDVLKLEEVPDPTPGAGQVVVRAHAIGVNPVETYIRKGIYGPKPFPYTPGSDAAGVVEAVGEGVAHLKRGDRVYTSGSISGTYAELILCEASQAHRLPENISFAQGAALGVPYATAYRALFDRGEAKPGETVLVHGATGGVGLAAVQLARAAGITVIGSGGSERGRKLALEQGAHHMLDHQSPGYLDELMNLTEQRGVDVILEMLANVNLGRDLAILAKRGRVVVVGSRGKVEVDPRDTMKRDADIRGMTLINASPDDLRRIHTALIVGLENGTLNPVIDVEFPLSDAPRAHEKVMENNSHGKIILRSSS